MNFSNTLGHLGNQGYYGYQGNNGFTTLGLGNFGSLGNLGNFANCGSGCNVNLTPSFLNTGIGLSNFGYGVENYGNNLFNNLFNGTTIGGINPGFVVGAYNSPNVGYVGTTPFGLNVNSIGQPIISNGSNFGSLGLGLVSNGFGIPYGYGNYGSSSQLGFGSGFNSNINFVGQGIQNGVVGTGILGGTNNGLVTYYDHDTEIVIEAFLTGAEGKNTSVTVVGNELRIRTNITGTGTSSSSKDDIYRQGYISTILPQLTDIGNIKVHAKAGRVTISCPRIRSISDSIVTIRAA